MSLAWRCLSRRWPPAARSRARRSATDCMSSTWSTATTTTRRPRTSSRALRARRKSPPSWIPCASRRPPSFPSPQRYSISPRASQTCRGRTCSSTALRTAPGSPSARPAPSQSSNSTARSSRKTRRPPRRSSRRYGRSSSGHSICKFVEVCCLRLTFLYFCGMLCIDKKSEPKMVGSAYL